MTWHGCRKNSAQWFFFWAWNSKSGIDVSDTDKVFKRTEKDYSFLTFQ